jgi:hypothetical protein
MRSNRFQGSFGRLLAGFVLLALGTLFLLDNLGWIDAERFFDLWPLILVFFGITRLMRPTRKGFGLFLVIFGLWLLLYNFDIFRQAPWDLWPLLLILLGGALIWQAMSPGRLSPGTEQGGYLTALAIVGGSRHRVVSKEFRGGEATAILGGCIIDLRDAAPGGDRAVLDVFALGGGIEILVSEHWQVDMRGRPILGGFADERTRIGVDPKHLLIVKGTAIMGGVAVKD